MISITEKRRMRTMDKKHNDHDNGNNTTFNRIQGHGKQIYKEVG